MSFCWMAGQSAGQSRASVWADAADGLIGAAADGLEWFAEDGLACRARVRRTICGATGAGRVASPVACGSELTTTIDGCSVGVDASR
jgi:hypothetical protein